MKAERTTTFSLKRFYCCLILLLPAVLQAQSRYDSLTVNLQKIMSRDSLPGMSVVLVDAEHVIYQKNFGYSDVANKIPYTSETLQHVGSVSKTFIAVALMKAIELNYFNLETDINDILPFKIINPHTKTSKITIRELANHTSGIIDNPAIYPNTYHFYPNLRPSSPSALGMLQQYGYEQKIANTSMKEFFYDYLSTDGKYYSEKNFVNAEPGSSSVYSNIASALVAYLIEIKSGITYAEFANKYILNPLKMEHSGWFLSSVNLERHALLYINSKEYLPLYDLITYPDGGLKTTSADLSKYLQAIIKGYRGDTTLLSEASFKAMFKSQFESGKLPKGFNATKRNKGIFWNLYTNGTIGHDGDDPGVSAFLFFNTTTGKGGLFMCNKYMDDKSPIIGLLIEAVSR
ncbi:serine hydrolase domain-containing protein [Mucilaginibacter agri]|uniref:Serine hydrolase n=1 Tax=Mucilaginibacter agri TaxID=2695265 RepID=A0A966DR86_9SPHI|nr:serine hydrolase domain-containing protein [Mucilaginibacter agri]NCD68230.1 serine hydrolase [Mucilaginibacter agri]